MLGRFAVDYAKAQNIEEVAEFSGGALFEIVLAALLIVFTGGVGLAARGAASVSYLDKLTRLGNALKRLSAALKRARIRRGGRARGSGTGARTVEVERPKEVKPGTVQTPAEEGHRRQTGSGYFSGTADEAYEAIRASNTDVADISKNTGIKIENVQKVKDHLFYEEHLLDRYVEYGIPAQRARFDSDMGIANAWKRLENGTHTPDDMKLLRHETAEAWYMRRNDSGYTDAHNAAERRYPAPKLEN